MEPENWTRIFESNIGSLEKSDTWRLEFDESIKPKHLNLGWKEYFRKTVARFRCTTCGRTWPSNRVMVIFHMHLQNGQGTVKVRPTRQNCKRCVNAPMVKPNVDTNNISILMENLVKKIRIKCYGENLGRGNSFAESINVNNPHEPSHCEGCKLGICTRETDMLMYNA